MYALRFSAYCGMTSNYGDGERSDARTTAAHAIRRYRRTGGYVAILERGKRWEFCEDEERADFEDNERQIVFAS